MRERYHRLRPGLDSVKSLLRKDANNTDGKSVCKSLTQLCWVDSDMSNYIYVRSHEIGVQIGCDLGRRVEHIVTVNTSTRSLWKKVVSQRYLCRQARPKCTSLEYSSYLRKQENHLLHARTIDAPQVKPGFSEEGFSGSEIPSYTRYKRVSLQAYTDNEAFVLATLNTSRERVLGIAKTQFLRKRVSSLKVCKKGIFKDRKSEEKLLQRGRGKIDSREQDVQSIRQTQSTIKVKSIWRKFNNTFMRNGSKLRYQTMLRKALLA